LKTYILLFWILFTLCCCQEKHTSVQLLNSTQIEDAPWGVEFNVLPPHIDRYPHQLENISNQRIEILLDRASELGVKWVRLSVNWSNIVDTAGNYHWEFTDRIVEGLTRNKIKIACCINGGHILYTKGMAPVSVEAIEHWKDFVRIFVKRYNETICNWELWNEPNTVWFWKPYPKAEQYVQLMKEFHGIIKSINTNSTIIGGSLARLDLVYADSLFRYGIGKYIDAFSFHPYNEFPEAIITPVQVSVKTPEWYIETDHSVYKLKSLIDSVNSGIRLWQAECGYPSQGNGSGWMGNGLWSPTVQAKWLLRRMLVDLSYNAQVISYFSLVEYNTSENIDKGKGVLNSKGLLSLDDLNPKPAYKAYQNLISVLNNSLKAKVNNHLMSEIVSQGSFYNIKSKNLLFVEVQNKKGQNFLAYWAVWRMQDVVTEGKISVELETPFRHPVLINLLSGEVLEIPGKDFSSREIRNLPLADYPFIIAEMESIIF